MSLRIQCTACSMFHSVHNRLAGRSIRCPACDALIEVVAKVENTDEESGDSPEWIDDAEPVDAEFDEDIADLVEDVELVEDGFESKVEDGDAIAINSGAWKQSRSFIPAESGDSRNSNETDLSFGYGDGFESDDDEMEEIAFAKKELPKDDMDMTPMVDVTFLLLIFFMITASFSSEKVIEEPPSMADASQQQKEEQDKVLDTVRVQVDEFNAYTIILPGGEDRQASSKQDLLMALDDARREVVTGANDEALRIEVEAHVDSIHAAVIAALDAGRDKGFSSFQVTVVEEFD